MELKKCLETCIPGGISKVTDNGSTAVNLILLLLCLLPSPVWQHSCAPASPDTAYHHHSESGNDPPGSLPIWGCSILVQTFEVPGTCADAEPRSSCLQHNLHQRLSGCINCSCRCTHSKETDPQNGDSIIFFFFLLLPSPPPPVPLCCSC